jgi:hypothetical protein
VRRIRCKSCGEPLKPVYFLAHGMILFFAAGAGWAAWVLGYTYLDSVLGAAPVGVYMAAILAMTGAVAAGIGFANARCVCAFRIDDGGKNQFSLLQAQYAVLVLAALIGGMAIRRGHYAEAWLSAYFMWGLLEAARYVTMRRARKSKE